MFPLKSTIEPTRNSPFVMGVPAHGFGPLHFALAEAAYSSLYPDFLVFPPSSSDMVGLVESEGAWEIRRVKCGLQWASNSLRSHYAVHETSLGHSQRYLYSYNHNKY